ncbi:BON domain-containing protein [Humibacter sp. BT305]|nr:BON domain-containing protein [Humibacter sp. BT305]
MIMDSTLASDLSVQQKVTEELAWLPGIDSSSIGVAVDDGVVILSGEVDLLSDRHSVVKAVQRLAGVVTVVDDIVVRGEPGAAASDVEIAEAVNKRIAWLAALPQNTVRARVEHGLVILEGVVEHDYQRRAVERLCGHIPYVTAVSNRLQLAPEEYAAGTQEELRRALRRQQTLNAFPLSVTFRDGIARVEGTVPSAALKRAAGSVLWKHPAVRDVENEITVRPNLVWEIAGSSRQAADAALE